jgi:hypothetical protein
MYIIREAMMSCMGMIHDLRRPDRGNEDRVHNGRPEQLERVRIIGEGKYGELRLGELFAEEEAWKGIELEKERG